MNSNSAKSTTPTHDHRRTVHDLRGMLNSISLNLMLLGKAARGELVGMENIQERQIGWVQSMEDELARLNSSLDAWAEVLLNTDESKDEEPSKEPALKPTGGGSQSND